MAQKLVYNQALGGYEVKEANPWNERISLRLVQRAERRRKIITAVDKYREWRKTGLL